MKSYRSFKESKKSTRNSVLTKKAQIRRKPIWDDSVNDLEAFKLKKEELEKRKKERVSKNHINQFKEIENIKPLNYNREEIYNFSNQRSDINGSSIIDDVYSDTFEDIKSLKDSLDENKYIQNEEILDNHQLNLERIQNENNSLKKLLEENKNIKEILELIKNTVIASNQEISSIKNEFKIFKDEINLKFLNLINGMKLDKASSFTCNNNKYDYVEMNENDSIFNSETHTSLPLYSDMRNHEF